MKLINIGFGNMVSAGRVVAVVSPDSAPVKRLVKEARERGMLIDASYGRSTRAVLIMDSDHVVLSALQPETVANRAAGQESRMTAITEAVFLPFLPRTRLWRRTVWLRPTTTPLPASITTRAPITM